MPRFVPVMFRCVSLPGVEVDSGIDSKRPHCNARSKQDDYRLYLLSWNQLEDKRNFAGIPGIGWQVCGGKDGQIDVFI